LGGRGDAATALAEADYHIDAATQSSANGPPNVVDSCRARAASSARAEPAAGRAIAKEAVKVGRVTPCAPPSAGRGLPALPLALGELKPLPRAGLP